MIDITVLLIMLLLFHFIVRRNAQWNVLMLWLCAQSTARLTSNISQHAVKVTLLYGVRPAGMCRS